MPTEGALLNNQCHHCKIAIKILSIHCQSCKVVRYCSEKHKAAGRPDHADECKAIGDLRADLKKQEQILREDPDGDVFNSRSVFWGIGETRPYTNACVGLIESLSRIPTVTACKAALDYGFEWLELNWGVDHRNVKYRLAALQIRLGNDQDAYDFMKWYATTGTDPEYKWVELYDLEGENASESLQAGDWTDNEKTHLSTMASIMLVKLRIWLNLRSLYNARFLATKLPQEIVDQIREGFIATGIVADNQGIMRDVRDGSDIETVYMRPLEHQLSDMFVAIERSHPEFWSAIIEGKSLADRFENPDHRDRELCVAVSAVHSAFEETAGAIEWVSNKLQRHINTVLGLS